MLRSHGGNNDHPNSLAFIQLYRILSTYSLVKPPKGCNVQDQEIMNCLIALKDVRDQNSNENFRFILDRIVDQGIFFEEVAEVLSASQSVEYFAGYVSRKAQNFTNCKSCLQTLISETENENLGRLIHLRNVYGLTIPSPKILQIVALIEETFTAQLEGNVDICIIQAILK